MISSRRAVGLTAVWLIMILQTACPAFAQADTSDESDCMFDTEAPTVLSARASFLAGDYSCAEKELNTLLAEERLGSGTLANAHMLLAAVYFESTSNPAERRQKVRRELVQGLQADPNWSGSFEVTSPEFLSIYNDAREMVDYINRTTPQPTKPQADTVLTSEAVTEVKEGGKPWYRRWWALGSGVGVVVLGAVLILSGGDSGGGNDTTTVDTLPGFPPPP